MGGPPTEAPLHAPGTALRAGCGDQAASVNLGEGTPVRITRFVGGHRPKPRKTAPDARVGCLARRVAVVQQQPRLAKQPQPAGQPFTAWWRPTFPSRPSCWTARPSWSPRDLDTLKIIRLV